MTSPFRELVNETCKSLPGSEWSDPWGGGHDARKLCDKMFACIGSMADGVSVKTDSVETASMLIDAGVGIKAPYFHRSWIRVEPGTAKDEVTHRINVSYDLIRAGLPKKKTANLPPRKGSE